MVNNETCKCKPLTTDMIARVFIDHVNTYKNVDVDRDDYFDFSRAIEIAIRGENNAD